MKNQKQLKQLLAKQVEEISLAKDKAMGFRSPVNKIEDSIVSLQGQAKLHDDAKLNAIIKKLETVEAELTKHLDATYQW